nr:hypothetical protein [Sinobaca sp. H24]
MHRRRSAEKEPKEDKSKSGEEQNAENPADETEKQPDEQPSEKPAAEDTEDDDSRVIAMPSVRKFAREKDVTSVKSAEAAKTDEY